MNDVDWKARVERAERELEAAKREIADREDTEQSMNRVFADDGEEIAALKARLARLTEAARPLLDTHHHSPENDGRCDMCALARALAEGDAVSEHLKPCPFCGGAPQAMGEDHPFMALCRAWCTQCQAGTPSYRTRAEAISAWNRRVPDSETLIAENEAFRRCDRFVAGGGAS